MRRILLLVVVLLSTHSLSAAIRKVSYRKVIEQSRYELVDIVLDGRWRCDDPFEVQLHALFISPSGKEQIIPAFYIGDNKWAIRFSAAESGEWRYSTQSEVKTLNGKKGKVVVAQPAASDGHGAVVIDPSNPQKLAREDGSDFFLMGFETDFLFALNYHSEAETPELDAYLDQVKRDRFNYMVMNVYGYDVKWEQDARLKELPEYNFGSREDIFPFLGTNSDPDYSSLNLAYFDHLDRLLSKLDDRDIIAHLMIYVWSKKVAWPVLDSPEGNRFFDYVVKRYQAFPNVVWDISKEALSYNRVKKEFIAERIDRLRKIDSYDRLVTVHDYGYCRQLPETVDFMIKQDWGLNFYHSLLEMYQTHPDKPCVNIEMGGYEQAEYKIYENGNFYDAETCLRRNYEGVFAGSYPAHYWMGASWNIIFYDWFTPKWKDAYRPKMEYYTYMRNFFDRYPYRQFRPEPKYNGSGYCMTDDAGLYLFYMPKESRKTELWRLKSLCQGEVSYRWFNTHTGEFTPLKEFASFPELALESHPWFLEHDAILVFKTTPVMPQAKPRVVVTTDININKGDPDDRQSLAHMLFYADEIDIRAIVVDRVDADGLEATQMAIDAYRTDYMNEAYNFRHKSYPHPDSLEARVYTREQAIQRNILGEIADQCDDPLYVAVWGNMDVVHANLDQRPDLADKLRLLTIATATMSPYDTDECGKRNWNDGSGSREKIYNDPRFDHIWWVENDWGYNGMFEGDAPSKYLDTLSEYGALGQNIKAVVKKHSWAQYFRVGDTPTIMYFIENNHLDDPTQYNLGGCFVKPFPQQRPSYYMDAAEGSKWDYAATCEQWSVAKQEVAARAAEMTKRRNEMYRSCLIKLKQLYNRLESIQ